MPELAGLDLDAVTRWLSGHHRQLIRGPLSGRLMAGGKSNLTYRVSDGESTWALRRPPLGHVLSTAHDMAREYRVISALESTDVPAPSPIAFCPDPAVIGAPFYLMSFVEGGVIDQSIPLQTVPPEAASRASRLLVDTLVRLHAVDPAQVGLADFGRPEGFLARQVTRWHTQWQANETQPRAVVEPLVDQLAAAVPPQSAPGITHGDYRLQNVMFAPGLDRVAAVVDWEMATLGDPLTDLGLLVVYQTLSATSDLIMTRTRPADGFLTADQLLARYAERSERDLAHLDWYVGFGFFKLAVIAEGIHHRFLQGKTVGDGFAQFGPAVGELLDSALRRLAPRRPVR